MLSTVFRKALLWICVQSRIPDPLPTVDTFSPHLLFFLVPAFQIAQRQESPLCSLQPFPRIMYFVLFGIALTDEKSNLKFFEILGLQTTPSQWKSMDAYFNGRVSVFHGIDYW